MEQQLDERLEESADIGQLSHLIYIGWRVRARRTDESRGATGEEALVWPAVGDAMAGDPWGA
jgi:hypothetical protein